MKKASKKPPVQHGGARVIAFGFALLILAGALLLKLPAASANGDGADFFTCLFTSTSASCVTGLVLCDTGTSWSLFGQIVILCLIQVGGVGFMTLALMLSVMLRRSITPKERLIAAQSFNLPTFGGVVRLVKKAAFGTFAIEAAGALLLAIRFIPIFGARGIWYSVFTSISAFCNAGFDLMGGYSGAFSSLSAFRSDVLVNLTVMALILLGGVGFIAWDEIIGYFKSRRHISTYVKLILIFSAVLVIGGFVSIAALEWNNDATLGGMSTSEKLLAAAFQSVTTRTAGFNTFDLSQMNSVTKLVFLMLMFIGGCSGSTAGGVKVGTAAVAVFGVLSILRGKSEVAVFRRRISQGNVLRAYGIIALQFTVTLVGGFIIMSCGCPLMSAMFESFSASATVGLSLSLTSAMNSAGKIAALVLMYFGRVGILTVSYAIMSKLSSSEQVYHYAEARMPIG